MRNRLLEQRIARFDSIQVSPTELDRVARVLDSLPGLCPEERLDAGETAFLARQLEYVKAKTYDVKYAGLRFREFIPISNEVDTGADSIVWTQYDDIATASIISNYAADLQEAQILGQESTPVKVRSIGSAYGYSVQELRAAMFANVDLEVKRAKAARRSIEQTMDSLAALGSTKYSLAGFAKLTGVPIVSLPNGTWSTATNAQVLEDMLYLVAKVDDTSKGEHVVTDLLLGSTQWLRINSKHFSTDNSRTVLSAFREIHPKINVNKWARLDTANATDNGNRMIAYEKSADNIVCEIPQEFEQFSPQVKGFQTVIPCHARFGGCFPYYPLSAAYADGT